MTTCVHVLDPLGGQDNLMLFCNVTEFNYVVDDRHVVFSVGDKKIDLKTNWDFLFQKQIWSMKIIREQWFGDSELCHYGCITSEGLLRDVFEKYVHFLSF